MPTVDNFSQAFKRLIHSVFSIVFLKNHVVGIWYLIDHYNETLAA